MANVYVQRATRRSMVLFACENVLLTAVVAFASIIVLDADPRAALAPSFVWKSALVAVISQLCLYYADSHELGLSGDRRELLVRILQGLGASSVILGTMYFVFPKLVIGQGVVTVAALLAVIGVGAWRVAFTWASAHVAKRRRF